MGYIHPTMDCSLDGAIYVGASSPTEYTFTETDGSPEGTEIYFSCDVGNGAHCRYGQNMIVVVYSTADQTSNKPSFSPSLRGTTDLDEDEDLLSNTTNIVHDNMTG